MTDTFVYGSRAPATPVTLITAASSKRFSNKLPAAQQQWLTANGFAAEVGALCALPAASGELERFVFCAGSLDDPFAIAELPMKLPEGIYALEGAGVKPHIDSLAIGWGLGAYRFSRYKKAERKPALLKLPNSADQPMISEIVAASCLVRDLINTPAEDMMPQHLAQVLEDVAETHGAHFQQIVGDDLLAENYPCVHTVGRASVHPPRLLRLDWGNIDHPRVTLVGKGVVFDSGGLDIKPAAGMRQMKKDMGGAAHAIGLAQLLMALELPIRLCVLVPSAENAISSNSFRPGDVIRTRAGLSVEIDNTDAEGRLLLCDALADACEQKPDLLVDFATLTGAARVAVGTEIAAYFCSDAALGRQMQQAGEAVADPVWELPLHAGYNSLLKSHVADLQNSAASPFGGAITAALYLQHFVDQSIPWLHFDIMAFNNRSRPGRPIGGEAMGLRAMFELLSHRYAKGDRS